jgi:hypothetical protein
MKQESTPANTPIETEDLRFLDPRRLRFQPNGVRLRLAIEGGDTYSDVSVVRVFPLSNPRRYLSVRDAGDAEIGLIVDAGELDAASRRLVEEHLERRYIVPVVQRVLSARERFGTVDWTVETDRGVRSFTTRNLRENVVQPAPNRYVLTDVDGNRYDVRDVEALDGVSRAWLLRYI